MSENEYIYNGVVYASFEAFLLDMLENGFITVEVRK